MESVLIRGRANSLVEKLNVIQCLWLLPSTVDPASPAFPSTVPAKILHTGEGRDRASTGGSHEDEVANTLNSKPSDFSDLTGISDTGNPPETVAAGPPASTGKRGCGFPSRPATSAHPEKQS